MAADITRRFWVAPLPLLLLLVSKEPYLGWSAFDPPAFLDGLEVPVNLNLIQGALLVFAVFPLESGCVPILISADVVAEVAVERSAMNTRRS